MTWTGPSDIKSQVQKWWDRGELLSGIVTGDSMFPRRLRLKEPSAQEITERFEDVRDWIAALRTVPHCRVTMREVKHRVFGKNNIPCEIWVDTLDAALSIIGKRKDSIRFESLTGLTDQHLPKLLPWLARKPLRALELHDDWERLLSVVTWLIEHPRPGIYLRQIDVPGVHTKFIEAHRGTLTEWLEMIAPANAGDCTITGVSQFARRYGFRDKPARIRFRVLDPSRLILRGGGDQDITLDSSSFANLDPNVSRVFITENEINFLAFTELPDSMVIFGAGYGFDMLLQAVWLAQRKIFYWGDIDTHGFAILNSVRAQLPQTHPVLMNEATLVRYRRLWVTEESQHAALALPNLTDAEQTLYGALKAQSFGSNIRLEQERIDWSYAWESIQQLCRR